MSIFRPVAAVLLVAGALAGRAEAAPLTFDFAYESTSRDGSATGFVTIDDAAFSAAGSWSSGGRAGFSAFPGTGVTAFSITVVDAVSGNGTFDSGDILDIVLEVDGPLDTTRDLVGQADFANFNVVGIGQAPSENFFFRIATNGGTGETLELASFIPREVDAPIPLPAPAFLLLAALLGLWGASPLRH